MKKWVTSWFILAFISVLCSCNYTGPYAYIYLRETNPPKFSIENKKTTLAKVDSTFLTIRKIESILAKFNNPKYQDARFIKKRIQLEQFETGAIRVRLNINDQHFSCAFLDSLFTSRIDEMLNEDTKRIDKKHRKIGTEKDSCLRKWAELGMQYEKEMDPVKKVNLDKMMKIAYAQAENLLELYVHSAGEIPMVSFYITAKANWNMKK